MIRTVSELNLASVEQIRAFLKAERVPFTESALKPELVEIGREFITKRNAKDGETKKPAPDLQEELDSVKTAEDALRLLQAKGFKDVEEVKAFIAVIVREKDAATKEKEALKATIGDIEQREIHMAAREKAVVEQAKSVTDDMKKQEAVYEKLSKLREQMRNEGSLASANV